MNVVFNICAGITALVITGCASSSDPKSMVSNRPKRTFTNELHQRRETIAYNWERQGIEVSFYRQNHDAYWTVTVRDSWSVMNQALSQGGQKKWELSESKASMQECLRLIDASLADFHTEKPTARLESIDIEMQIIKELWSEILDGLSQRLSTLGGEKSRGRFDVPPEIEQTLQTVVDNSPTTAAMRALVRKYGMEVGVIAFSEHVIFMDSLTGRKWREIATLPGVGILAPGTIEFRLAGR